MQTEPPAQLPHVLAAVPVFPLANTVLFPGVMLPLHIFEPRYQQMLRDVMAGSRYLVLSCADPIERRGVAAVGCLAQVMQVEQQAEGRSNVLVRGEARVQLLEEQPESGGYRRFRAQALPLPVVRAERYKPHALGTLQQFLCHLAQAAAGRDRPLAEVLRASNDPLTVADFMAASLVRDVRRQQAVLASPRVAERIDAMTDGLAEALLRLVGEDLARNARN